MWLGTGPDPGGSGASGPGDDDPKTMSQNQELTDLKDQAEQQQVLIAQLKEMLRKTDQLATTASLEKAEKLTTTLSKMQSRAKKNKYRKLLESEGEKSLDSSPLRPDTPSKEKMNLLKQQLEENRAKMAQRGKHQKGIEDMVTQLKAQMDDSQAIVNQTVLNISASEAKQPTPQKYSSESTNEELLGILTEKDGAINELTVRIQQLQANILDLQENVKEKDSVIDARTKAITLLSEDLSRKGKSTLDMLDETKEEMRLMQENFVKLESEMVLDKQKLSDELDQKNALVLQLEHTNTELNNRNSDLEVSLIEFQNENAKLHKELESIFSNLLEKDVKIQELERVNAEVQNVSADSEALNHKRIQELEGLNQRIQELEALNLTYIQSQIGEKTPEASSTPVEASPVKSGKKLSKKAAQKLKTSDDTAKLELENIRIENVKLQSRVDELEAVRERLESRQETVAPVKTEEVEKLTKQLDEMNKSMIKMKTLHKAKLKELQKRIEAFQKVSNVNAELVKIQADYAKSQQKIVELEEEKGALQLNLVDYNKDTIVNYQKTVAELTENVERQQQHIETQTELIRDLEKKKSELMTDLDKKGNDQVCSEMTSAQLEEQIDQLKVQTDDLTQQVSTISKENIALHDKLEVLVAEKLETNTRIETLIQENMDLVDRLEKLSAEKVSSTESIEIVESLTQQEKLEIEEYNQKYIVPEVLTELEQTPDLNDSVAKLSEESVELMEKIEQFTLERKEVNEKLEMLSAENAGLLAKINVLQVDKSQLEETYEAMCDEKAKIEQELSAVSKDNEQWKLRATATASEDITSDDVEAYKKLIETQVQDIAELNSQLVESRNECVKLGIEKGTIEEALQVITKERDEISNKNVSLESQLTTVRAELAIQTERINTLLQNETSLTEEVEQSIERIQTLNQLIALLEQDLRYNDVVMGEQAASIENLKLSQVENEIYKIEMENLKQAIRESSEQLEEYDFTISQNKNLIEDQTAMLSKFDMRIKETESLLIDKDAQIGTMKEERLKNEQEIAALQQENELKQRELQQVVESYKIKFQQLQTKISQNTDSIEDIKKPFEKEIAQLKHEKEERIEKMKKIAANLKKKAILCVEFEAEIAKLRAESVEEVEKKRVLSEQVASITANLDSLNQQLIATTEEKDQLLKENQSLSSQLTEKQDFEKMESLRKESDNTLAALEIKNEEINRYLMQLQLLQDTVQTRETEVLEGNKKLEELQIKLSAVTAKNQEQEMVIENLEQEKEHHRHKSASLEESLSTLQEDRQQLETHLQKLVGELQQKSSDIEQLISAQRLFDEEIGKMHVVHQELQQKIVDVTSENSDLSELRKISDENVHKLQIQLNAMEQKIREHNSEIVLNLEEENTRLKSENLHLENELTKNQLELRHEREQKKLEIDNLEAESSTQYEEFDVERRRLLEQCETNNDVIKQCSEEINILKAKIMEIESDNNSLSNQNQELLSQNTHFEENQGKAAQLVELGAIIVEKDAQIENYQRQNMQLQMNAFSDTNSFNLTASVSNEELELLRNNLSQQQVEYTQLLERFNTVDAHYQNMIVQLNQEIECLKSNSRRLERQNATVREEQAVQTSAESEISNIIWLAEERVNEPAENIFTEAKPVEEHITPVMLSTSHAEHGKDSDETRTLKEKIKALQFMLHDSEQSKDDALLLCQDLLNEVTRRDYEKERLVKKYERSEQERPIGDDILNALESQIITAEQVDAPVCVPIVDVPKMHAAQTSTEPISEHIEPKKAYVCFKEDEEDPLGLDTDTNLWGSDEATLEEAHHQSSDKRVSELEEKIHDLELERSSLFGEIKELQVRNGKLIRKLKEFKATNDQLKSKAVNLGGFGDLDKAIEDELKAQIVGLEQILKDTKTERENLRKQVDVLTTANERMVDMKEKQDVEVQIWQAKYREASNKLNQLEWDFENVDSPKTTIGVTPAKNVVGVDVAAKEREIVELNAKINDLAIDNEELQCLLEEEVQKKVAAEKKLMEVSSENDCTQLWDDYNTVVTEKNSIIQELESMRDERDQLEVRVGELEQSVELAVREKINLMQQENASDSEVDSEKLLGVSGELAAIREEYAKLKTQFSELTAQISKVLEERDLMDTTCNKLTMCNLDLNMQISEMTESVDNLTRENEEKMEKINQLLSNEAMITETYSKAVKDLKHLTTELSDGINGRDQEIRELNMQINAEREDTQQKLAQTVEQWSMEVEKRGMDVAESWKAHLETRESEYTQLVESLQAATTAATDKYNALMQNKTESEIQQAESVHDKQTLTQELENTRQRLNNLEVELAAITETCTAAVTEKSELEDRLAVALKAQQEVVAELETARTDLVAYESDLAAAQLKYKSELTQRTENEVQQSEINREKQSLVDALEVTQQKILLYEEELTNMKAALDGKNQELHQLRRDFTGDQEKVAYFENEMQNQSIIIDTKSAQIQQLNAELIHLKEKSATYDQKLESVNGILEQKTLEYEKIVADAAKNQQTLIDYEVEIQNLNIAIKTKDEYLLQMKEQLATQDKVLHNLENEQLKNLNMEIERLNQVIAASDERFLQDLYEKEVIINNANISMEEQVLKYNQFLVAKDSEIANLNLQLQAKTEECDSLRASMLQLSQTASLSTNDEENFKIQLKSKQDEIAELESKLMERECIIDEDTKQLADLKDLIETQVLKIEEMKQQQGLTYPESDPESPTSGTSNEKRVHFPDETSSLITEHRYDASDASISETDMSSLDDPSELVSRGELDLALYMLHQRDVRCEELTVELMQLLEERDTLQLRLSNAIRMNEELRRKISPRKQKSESTIADAPAEVDPNVPTSSAGALRKIKSTEILLGATGAELAKEATEDHLETPSENLSHLKTKISQLHSIDYRRDMRLRDEPKVRHLQQLSLMQQHRDLAAKLPAEAAARLVDANYTLSRETESASTVLLNWLWGRGTPKVNHL